MMSSKRAAAKAAWELWQMVASFGLDSDKVIFESHSRMRPILSRSAYSKKIKKWDSHGLLKKRKISNRHIFRLTTKGKLLRQKAPTKILRDDGLSTLVIFDIPESKHRARDIFRRFLIKNGYVQIQKSCYVSPIKISLDLKELIAELGLHSNVTMFSGKINQII